MRGGEPDGRPRAGASAGDAREHFRPMVKLAWAIDLALAKSGARIHRATTIGISVGGTFIRAKAPGTVGTKLRLWLHRPPDLVAEGPGVLPLHGEVRWISESGVGEAGKGFGVAFRALTARDEVTLHGYFSAALKVL